MGRRLRLALFTANIEGDDYSEKLWLSLNAACIKRDIDLYIYPCRYLYNHESHPVTMNHLYNSFCKDLFDGILFSTSPLITFLGKDIVDKYRDQLLDIPLVDIAYKEEDNNYVMIDNYSGMQLIIEHLHKIHNCKQIAYLSGPASNIEAIIRLKSVKEACNKRDITLNDKDIYWGNFQSDDLDIILDPLIKGDLSDIDALVCANDIMASEAIELMKKNRINIPGDIIVTGFDNASPSHFQNPKITTINQPMRKMAERAVDMILDMINHKKDNFREMVQPVVLPRNSCGCQTEENFDNEFNNMFEKSREHQVIRSKMEMIANSRSFPELKKKLEDLTESYDLESFYLFNNNRFDSERFIHCILSRCDGIEVDKKQCENDIIEQGFLSEINLPHKSRTTLIILPLLTIHQYYGIFIIEVKDQFATFFNDLTNSLTSAIMNITQLNEIETAHKKIVETERLRFLNNLVTGLAHEMNTPMGILYTTATHFCDSFNKILEMYKTEVMSKRNLENFFNDGNESLDLMVHNIERAIKLINKFKLVSSNSDYEIEETFNLTKLIKNIIEEHKNIYFELDAPSVLKIKSDLNVIEEIFDNLITNSIHHGFADREDGEISIMVKEEDKNIIIIYSDNGKTLKEEQLDELFNPFYTTHRGQGSAGLGLTITYNLIKNRLKGDIIAYIESENLHFKITIPTH